MIFILIIFCTIFGIIGVQFFHGVLKNRCVNILTGQVRPGVLCSDDDVCSAGELCGRVVGSLEDAVNFDTYPWAMLMVYQGLTQEAWSQIMAQLMTAVSYFTLFFYVPIIIIGPNLLTNLTMAIIKFKFSEIHHRKMPKVEEPESDRWEISRMKELVLNNVNLFYDRVSNLKYKGLITDKVANTKLVGTSWEKLKSTPQPRPAKKVSLLKEEGPVAMPETVAHHTTQKRITRMRQFSSIKLSYNGEDSEELLKKLHFEPIILRPFNKAVPEEEEPSEDSINTDDLLENIRRESPEARETRFRRRKMMEMRRFIADLKVKTGEEPSREIAEQASRFDFSKIDPETLQRNYNDLFSDMALDSYLHDIRRKDELMEVNFKNAPTEEDSVPPEEDKPLVAEFDKSMDLLKEVNLLIDKNLKIRIKPEDELQEMNKFEYESLLLNEQAKKEAKEKHKKIGKREERACFSLQYTLPPSTKGS